MTKEQIQALRDAGPEAAAELVRNNRGSATDRLLLALAADAGIFNEPTPEPAPGA